MSAIVSIKNLSIDEPDFKKLSIKKPNTNKTTTTGPHVSIKTDVLIIGAGLAGLSTALALPKSLSITILSKAALENCSSHYAQGGIAASLDKNDTIAAHVADTLTAGAGLCAPDNTTRILSAGQQAVQWLCAQGVPFTQISKINDAQQNSNTNSLAALKTANLHLTHEGGHGCRRVAHADDASGRHIMQTLAAKAQAATNITILPYHEALTLLNKPLNETTFASQSKASSKPQYCRGAIAFDHNTRQQLSIVSRAVVLTSGGLGHLFQRASAPNVCVGDGVMMAWQAGCRLANLEFIQFHPTGLALGTSSFLISEALRGEGGHLYCPQTRERFMLDYDARAELAPRDIVARAIAEQIKNNGMGYVYLDVSHLPADFLQQHFPQIYQTLLDLGIDITTDPIPVAPTAHYSCGGIVTCANGLTDVQGLYAAGEVAYTGLHGANRLASNSLLECVVVGRNIAAHLPRYLLSSSWTPPFLSNTQPIVLPSTGLMSTYQDDSSTDINNIINLNANFNVITAELKALMSSNMGIMRSAEQLAQALQQIQCWQQALEPFNSDTLQHLEVSEYSEALNSVNSSATFDRLIHFRLERQLQLAILIVQSAYQRCESRGGHYRQDYPDLASKPLISVIEPPTDKSNKMAGTVDWLYPLGLAVNFA
ncbi:L-aspartate oxidase [Psychrobacter sp. CAL346-MNA-CIBAN-0220]|uniref:L-aspartate oxidase n=1 Tax=Psychrobacter sp. CAL346-MNA-CIBAN-0220 TaxID=3140457 RepID=UPI00332F0DD1